MGQINCANHSAVVTMDKREQAEGESKRVLRFGHCT